MSNYSLLDFLTEGEQNAKTARELAQALGYDSIREVAAEIARLRKAGTIICSVTDTATKGNFLPANSEDVKRFVRRTEFRIRETERMLKPAKDHLQSEA